MAKQQKTETAFDLTRVKNPEWQDWDDVARWLSQELDAAVAIRQGMAADVRYAWDYYEQNRMRGSNAPWPDAADLPSPLAAEYVDALHARLMQIITVKPMWTVEGYGEAAKNAPFVEEFHQRAQEDERLQTYLDEWIKRGLVEGVGTLEVSEAFEMRRTITRQRVALQRDALTGQPIMGDDGQPQLARHPETGDFLEPQSPEEPSAEVDVQGWEPVRLGPEYDVVPFMDFGVLPAHARHGSQVWGYWKRFHRRVPQLKAQAAKGIYDEEAVAFIGTDDEAQNNTVTAPERPQTVSQEGMTAQKELFELQILADFDGKGEQWWRLTLHKDRRKLLRAKMDDRTTRYIRWMPFPKPGCVDHGYSLITNVMITVLEEDTARRNMQADRMALKIATPILRQQGALWDPYEQPFGPRAVIDVRNVNEIVPLQGIEDVPASVMAWRGQLRDDADRLVGQNDIARGVIAGEESKPTATQVATTAQASEVRVSVIRARLQEPMEELGMARHAIWKRTLSANPSLPVKRAMVLGRDVPGVEADAYPEDNRVTAQMLEGTFWFIPRGSVDTADPMRQRQDFNGLLQVLPAIIQMNPSLQMIFGTIPAAKALVEQMLRVYRWPDRQSFLGSEANSVFTQLQQQQEQQQMMAQMTADPRMQVLMGAMGGAPAGGSPMGGPPAAPPDQAGGGMPPMGVQ